MAGWDLVTDAVVVGSGGGGLCAAVTARARGLDVLVVEKTDLVGGSTAMSGGAVWIPNNPLMEGDSDEQALEYLDAVLGDAGPASSPARRRAYVHNGRRMVAFLQGQGVPFRWADGYADYYCDAPGGSRRGRTIEALPFDTAQLGSWADRLRQGMTASVGLVGFGTELTAMSYYNHSLTGALTGARVVARTVAGRLAGRRLVANGTALVARLLHRALQTGAAVWTDAPVRDLVMEGGTVVGVVVQRAGRSVRVGARHGVVLAAGGFSRSETMRARYGGAQATTAKWSRANPGDTGEVVELATRLGAATGLMDEAIWLPMPCLPDGSPPPYPARQLATVAFRARWRPGTIIVDATGQRYVNEALAYMELGQLMFARDRQVRTVPSWIVFDDRFRRRCLFGVLPGRLPEQWVRDGFVKRGRELGELAGQCGIDPAGLEAAVKRFNGFAHSGEDRDFHRGASAYDRFMGDPGNRPNPCLAPLERSPFYAIALYPTDVGTCGGVLTDEHARVVDTARKPIAGLYATGNSTASVMGRCYPGAGASVGPTCTFGFVAMNHIADARKGADDRQPASQDA